MTDVPQRTRVKICGITSPDDLAIAVDAGADAIGVICDVSVDTPREVTPDDAREIIQKAPPFVTRVLVTMAADAGEALRLVTDVGADVIQLHGDMPADDVARVRRVLPVIRAVDANDEDTIDAMDGHVDALLLDSVDADGAGGTGQTHDWTRAREHVEAIETPIVLAGGLTPENVGDAIDAVHPFGVDVASGVETEGGVKDPSAVRAFVRAATAGGP